MSPIRLAQATICLILSLLALSVEQGVIGACFALLACAYVALAREVDHG